MFYYSGKSFDGVYYSNGDSSYQENNYSRQIEYETKELTGQRLKNYGGVTIKRSVDYANKTITDEITRVYRRWNDIKDYNYSFLDSRCYKIKSESPVFCHKIEPDPVKFLLSDQLIFDSITAEEEYKLKLDNYPDDYPDIPGMQKEPVAINAITPEFEQEVFSRLQESINQKDQYTSTSSDTIKNALQKTMTQDKRIASGTIRGIDTSEKSDIYVVGKYHWKLTITAKYKDDVKDPWAIPNIYLYQFSYPHHSYSYPNTYQPSFIVSIDSDGNGISDVAEAAWGLKPKEKDNIEQYIEYNTISVADENKLTIADYSHYTDDLKNSIKNKIFEIIKPAINTPSVQSVKYRMCRITNETERQYGSGTCKDGDSKDEAPLVRDEYRNNILNASKVDINETTGQVKVTYPDGSYHTFDKEYYSTPPTGKSQNPTINKVATDSTAISGSVPTSVTGGTVKVTLPDNTILYATVDGAKHTWSVDLPEGKTLTVGQQVTAQLFEDNKTGSDIIKTSVINPITPKPTINGPVRSDAVSISGTGVKGATVTLTLVNGDTTKPIGTATIPAQSEDGVWSIAVPSSVVLSKYVKVRASQVKDGFSESDFGYANIVATTADSTSLVMPSPKVKVNDISDVSGDLSSIITAIKNANPGVSLPADDQFSLSSDKTKINIRFADDSVKTISVSDVAVQRDTSAAPIVTTSPITSRTRTIEGSGVTGATVRIWLPNKQAPENVTVTGGKWKLDLPSDVVLVAGQTIKVTQQENDKLVSSQVILTVGKTAAETFTEQTGGGVKVPATGDKVPVDNKRSLTQQEVTAVDTAVKAANTNPALPQGTSVKVNTKDASKLDVVFPDGSVVELNTDDVVIERTPAPFITTSVKTNTTSISGTGVAGATITLTLVNGDTTKPIGTTTIPTNSQDGAWSIAVPNTVLTDGKLPAGATVKATQQATGYAVSKPATTTVGKTAAEIFTEQAGGAGVKVPAAGDKVPVDNKRLLTQQEVTAVDTAVKAANTNPALPQGTSVTVNPKDNTKLDVTFPDGSVVELNTDDVVIERTPAPVITTSVKTNTKTITGTGVKGATVTLTLVNGQDTKTIGTATIPAESKDGAWTITVPNTALTNGKLPAGATVKATQQAPNYAVSKATTTTVGKTDAEIFTEQSGGSGVKKPSTKVVVEDITDVTAEISQIGTAIKNANTNPALPTGTGIGLSSDKSNIVVTFPDGSTVEFPVTDVAVQRGKTTTPTITTTVKTNTTSISGTGVAGATITLTLVNGDTTTSIGSVTIPADSKDGAWTITVPNTALTDGKLPAGATVKATQKAPELKVSAPATATVDKTDAEKIAEKGGLTGLGDDKVVADDVTDLSKSELSEITTKLVDKNKLPEGTTVTVNPDDSSKLDVTLPDGSVVQIPVSDVAVQRGKTTTPTITTTVKTNTTSISGTGVAGATVTLTLVNGDTIKTIGSVTIPADSKDGAWSIAVPDSVLTDGKLPAGATVKATQKAPELKVSTPATATVDKTDAEKIAEKGGLSGLDDDSKVIVDDSSKLTKDELTEIDTAITAKNKLPEDTTVTVNPKDNTKLDVTLPDGSTVQIPVADVVVERTPAPVITTSVKTNTTSISGTGVAGATVTLTLVNGDTTTSIGSVTIPAESKDGAWSIAVPDSVLTGGKLPAGATVKATQQATGYAVSKPASTTVGSTQADTTTVNNPSTKVGVDDPDNLTDQDKSNITDAVKEANPNLPEGTGVSVDDKTGNVVITLPDKSVIEIPIADVIIQNSAKPTVNTIDTATTTITGTGVKGAKITVTVGTGEDSSNYTTTVAENGKWSVQLPKALPVDTVVTVTQTEKDKAAVSITTKVVTKADNTDITTPKDGDKVPVDDPTNLTDEETGKIKDKVKELNPNLPDDSVITITDSDEDGVDDTVTITHKDGSKNTVDLADMVIENSGKPTVDTIDTTTITITGTGVKGAKITVTVGTGDNSTEYTATVGENGKWSIQLPKALPADTVVTVTQTEKDKAGVSVTTKVVSKADSIGDITAPSTKVEVDDPENLSDEEKAEIDKAVRDSNPAIPDDSTITITDSDNDGVDDTVTITHKDGSENTVNLNDVVIQKSAKPTVDAIDTTTTTITGTGIAGAKITVTVGTGEDSSNYTATVGEDGNWSVELPKALPAQTTVTVTQSEKDKAAVSIITAVKSIADLITIDTPDDKVEVEDIKHLTDEEKNNIEKVVRDTNPDLPKDSSINIDEEKGLIIITHKDGSSTTIPLENYAKQKPALKQTLVAKTPEKTSTPLANTGANITALLALMSLLTLSGSYLLQKSRKKQ